MALQSNYLMPDLSTSHYHRRIGQKYKHDDQAKTYAGHKGYRHDGQGKTYAGHVGRNKRQGIPDAWVNSDAPTYENNYPTHEPAGQSQRIHKVAHQPNLRDAAIGSRSNPLRDSVIGNRQHVEASGHPAYATWKDSNNKEHVRELRPVAPSRVAAAYARRQERAQRLAELTAHLATIEGDERRTKEGEMRRNEADDPAIKRLRKRDPMMGKPRISLKLHKQLLSKPMEYKVNLQNELHSRARHLLKAFYEETGNTKLPEELEAENTNWTLCDILLQELKAPKLQEMVWKERIVNLLNLLEHYGSGVGVPRELPYHFPLEEMRRQFPAGGNIYPLNYSPWFMKHAPSTPKHEFTDAHPYGLPSGIKKYVPPTTTSTTPERMMRAAKAAYEAPETTETVKHNPLPRPPHPYDPNVLVKDKAERTRIQEENKQKKRFPPPVSPQVQDWLDSDTKHEGEADDNDDPFYKGTWEGPTSLMGEWRTWSNGSPPPAEKTSPASSPDEDDAYAVASYQAPNDVSATTKKVKELTLSKKASMALFPDGDESVFAGSLRKSSKNTESTNEQMPQPGKLVPNEWMIKAVEDEWKALSNESDDPFFKPVAQPNLVTDCSGIPSSAGNSRDKTSVPQIMVRGPYIPNFGYDIIREEVPAASSYDKTGARAWADIPKISPRVILEANFDRATFDRSSALVTSDADPADESQAKANNLWDTTTDIAATYKDTPMKETQLVKFAETVKESPEVSFSREPGFPATYEDRIFWRKIYKHRPPQYLQKTTGHLFDQAPQWAVVKKLPTVQSTKAEKERVAAREKAEKEEQERAAAREKLDKEEQNRTDALYLGAGLSQDDEMFGMGGLPKAVSDGGYKHHSSHNSQNIASPSKWLSPNLRIPFDGPITAVPKSVRGPAQGTSGLAWPVSPNFQHGHNHNGMTPGHGHGGIWHPQQMQPPNLGNGYNSSWAPTQRFNGQQQTFGQQHVHVGPYGTRGTGATTTGYGNGTWQQGSYQTMGHAGPGYPGSNGQHSPCSPGTRACGVGPNYGGFGPGNGHHHNIYIGPTGPL